MHRRRPAGRDQQRVDGDLARRTTAIAGNADRVHTQLAAGLDHRMPCHHFDAELARLGKNRLAGILAAIDDGRHGNAGALQVEGRFIGRVMGGVDADLRADGDAEMVEIGAAGRSEHDARPVIVGKHHVPFDLAVGKDHLLGTHLPQPLARQRLVERRQMIGHPFDQADEIVVVVAEPGGAGQKRDVVHGGKRLGGLLRPVPAILAVDRRAAFIAQRTAHFRLFVADDYLGARLGGGKCCRKSGNPGTDDEHVAMGVAARIVIRIGFRRGDAETGRAADEGFIDRVPGGLRPHEGLVVEAGGEERRHEIVETADVEGERRPAVLRFHLHAVEDFLHRGAHVRLPSGGITRHVEQRVRLFRTGRQNAARAVIFE
ncbi:hypothetical protein D9M70_476190 [compost metagenome]